MQTNLSSKFVMLIAGVYKAQGRSINILRRNCHEVL